MPKKTALPRKAISTRTRFEVFKRDGFVCQYCGAHPPDAILHVDHIVPVAGGGDCGRENLTTACDNCNRGKAAIPLSVVPQSLADQAARVAEAEKQLEGYREVILAQKQRRLSDCWDVIHIGWPQATQWRQDELRSVQKFIDTIGFEEVCDAMEISSSKFDGGNKCWLYFCGVCWRKIKEKGIAA